MPGLGYSTWALLPIDTDPLSGEPTSFNPPVITNLAVGLHASLIFEFASPTAILDISVESTALSAEQRGTELFDVLTGRQVNAYTRLKNPGWDLRYDGNYAVFSTRVERTETFLKLYFNQPQYLVVSRVSFSCP